MKYEGLMRLNSSVLPWSHAGKTAFTNWAAFCRDAVQGEALESRASWMEKNRRVREIEMEDLGMREGRKDGRGREVDLDDEMVEEMLREQRTWRVVLETELRAAVQMC